MSTISPPADSTVDLTLPEPDLAATLVTRIEPLRWSLATRIAFRITVVYFSLYVLCTQMLWALIPIPVNVNVANVGPWAWIRPLAVWVGEHVIGFPGPVSSSPGGSGDKAYDWSQAVTILGLSIVAAIVWSLVARSRTRHVAVQKWFRLFLRFSIASTMVSYGMVKLFPLQMPAPSLSRLLEPFGNFSPMGVLWASIGASKSYEMFAGAMELIAAVLLFIPGLTTIGALVCFAVVTQIFTLNMTYDVPVKLFSFHLLVMCAVLIAPELKRLAQFFVLNRAVEPSTEPPLLSGRRARRIAIATQIVFAAYIVGFNWYRAADGAKQFGADAPKPPLYGIWNIERMTIDGHERAPLVTDYDRWRRVLVGTRNAVSFQRMDSTFEAQTAAVDMNAKTMTLSKPANKEWGRFTFQQPAPDRLILDGTANGHAIRMETRLVDHTKFLLSSRGFNWVQELPFNR